ncbi:MAG: sulfite oxidase [Acidobacteria bacterium]|nr:sulfite oxidase [Acidobacteriota bacterium]
MNRRDFIAGISGAGTALGLSRYLPGNPGTAFTQELIKGKERLIIRSLRPEDLETPVGLLNSWITPKDLFYVRTHTYVPSIDERAGKEWKLKIDGEVERPIELTLDELKKMPRATVTVTLECAGNGRSFFDPPVAGIQWEKGAVGTARCTGARMSDILKKAGVKSTGKYIALDGADKPIGKMPDFIRNVPMEKAMHPDTIIAYEMNGEPIPMLHGFPLRSVVPGWEGAYAVKWLNHMQVIDKEHEGFSSRPPIAIPTGASLRARPWIPKIWFHSRDSWSNPSSTPRSRAQRQNRARSDSQVSWAGESNIARVDVSMDNGSTWLPAKLGKERERYAWQSFEYEFNIASRGLTFSCRAH